MSHNGQDTRQDAFEAGGSPAGPALLQVAWRRKALVLAGVAACLVLGGLYYAQAAPVYESKAQVLVVQKRPDAVTGVDTRRMAVEDYVSTQQALVRSPLIIERAIHKRGLASLSLFADERDDLLTVIDKALTVTRNRGTGGNNNVLDLSYRGKVADECGVVLEAIIESYKDFLDETYRSMSDDTLDLVTKARDVLQKDLAKKENAYREFRRKTPLLSRSKEGRSVWEDRLTGITTRRAQLLLRRADIQAQLRTIEKARKEGLGRDALLALAADFSSRMEAAASPARAGTISLQEQLQPLLAEEQKLLERYGENHPSVRSVRQRIQLTRDLYSSPAAPYRQPDAARKDDPVLAHVDYLKQQMEHVRASESLLDDLFAQEHDEVRKMTGFEIEDEIHRSDISRTQQLYDGIVKRLHDVGLVKVVGGYDAKTIASPGLGKRVSPRGTIVFPLAGVLGLLFGAGLAWLAELTDKSFRGVEDVRRHLGLPVVGAIPRLVPVAAASRRSSERGAVLDPLLCAWQQPRSMAAEAYRGVRTALYFSTQNEGHKVIQVTSPVSGDGKSTLASNLAVSIAQSGKRVLLLDADMRKPRVHDIFGLSSDVGLSSLVAGGAAPDDAIQESGVPGLWVLTAGPLPPNPAELLTSPRFNEALDFLRGRFDFVLVDSPPLLAVTDPSVIAPRVDGVLLTLRLSREGRPAAERAREILRSLGANVVGVVVNDTDRNDSGGGYGYGYGYGYAEAGEREVRRDPAALPAPPHRAAVDGNGAATGQPGGGLQA